MALGFSKTRYSPIAIDFGADSLKLLQVIPGDPPQMVAAASATVPAQARTDPEARYAFLAQALRDLLKSQPFKGRRAICSLPAFQALVQNLEVTGEAAELDTHVQLQLQQRWNIDPRRMVVRHFHVGQVVRDGTPLQEVICLAASRDIVMRYVELANRCRLDLVGMHSEPWAIVRAFEPIYRDPADAQRTICFIDLGAATSKVVITHGSQIVFAKAIHAAGDAAGGSAAPADASDDKPAVVQEPTVITGVALRAQGAAQARSAAAADAATGLAILDAQVQADAPADPTPPKPAAEIDEMIECLVDELQLCLRYHQSVYPGRPVERLVFLGGGARDVQTCQTIARAARIAAQLGDPLARVTRIAMPKPPTGVDLNQPQPGWAVPLGLCLSEANL